MGRLELKLLAVLVLLTAAPVAVALWQAGTLFERSLGAGVNPRVAGALDDAVKIYGDYVRAEKARQRAVAERLAESPALQARLAAGPAAATEWLRGHAAQPRVFAIELVPAMSGVEPLRVESPLTPTDEWLQRTETVPLPYGAGGVMGGYVALRYTFGLERAFIERFDRMEEEVIRPFAALAADRDNVADVYAWSFVGYLTAAVFLAALVSVVVGRRITRRVKRLRRAMNSVAGGDLHARVTPEGHDELADLARDFNEMARRLEESSARVQYLTQVSAWQGIARRLAHEIKNPLTPILLSVQQLQKTDRTDAERFGRVLTTVREVVEEEVHNLERLVDNFSRFARLPAVRRAPEDVARLARDLVAAHPEIESLAARAPDAPLIAAVDRGLLRQALANLVKNGAEAARAAGRAPQVVLEVRAEADATVLAVEDNGPGVPLEDRQRVFEPYVTGKSDGTGLGLAIVKKIVLDHGGTIAVTEAALGGARFEIRLPASDLARERGLKLP